MSKQRLLAGDGQPRQRHLPLSTCIALTDGLPNSLALCVFHGVSNHLDVAAQAYEGLLNRSENHSKPISKPFKTHETIMKLTVLTRVYALIGCSVLPLGSLAVNSTLSLESCARMAKKCRFSRRFHAHSSGHWRRTSSPSREAGKVLCDASSCNDASMSSCSLMALRSTS